ncbi:hypothetical protein BDZ91DRAFT_716562 [Kalaharituber pfeilii]|nr:hypothetical protein BDZ91DRAFT_716562 [Kalaharituber pfeilii]
MPPTWRSRRSQINSWDVVRLTAPCACVCLCLWCACACACPSGAIWKPSLFVTRPWRAGQCCTRIIQQLRGPKNAGGS